jgi:2-polyprenyl-3-methyl-5-hydroxy-6-metoxy-1,4-benzoquinol methylase
MERNKWIDVGAGIGDLVSVAREKGWDAVGLELSNNSVKFSKEIFGLDLIQTSLENYIRENPDLVGKIDVISFIGVLEHTPNPLELLRMAHNLFKKDGYIVVQVPNADSFTSMIQSIFTENVFRHMNSVEHIMLFPQKSLIKALEITDFEPITMWFYGMDVYELLNNLPMLNEKNR